MLLLIVINKVLLLLMTVFNQYIINIKKLRKMTKKVSYDEVSVAKSLSRKSSVSVNTHTKAITIKEGATDVGNGSWGKIDYLCKIHGYVYRFSRSTGKSIKDVQEDSDDSSVINKKSAKRQAKLNMAAATKAVMHKIRK